MKYYNATSGLQTLIYSASYSSAVSRIWISYQCVIARWNEFYECGHSWTHAYGTCIQTWDSRSYNAKTIEVSQCRVETWRTSNTPNITRAQWNRAAVGAQATHQQQLKQQRTDEQPWTLAVLGFIASCALLGELVMALLFDAVVWREMLLRRCAPPRPPIRHC